MTLILILDMTSEQALVDGFLVAVDGVLERQVAEQGHGDGGPRSIPAPGRR